MGKTQASPEQPIPASDDELEGGGSTNYPWYTPKFWYGMGSGTWIRLMVENGAVISPSRFHILITASMLSLLNTLGRIISDQLYSSRLRNSKLPNNPIFIIGHWRSGTTLLHELLMLDQRFSTPNTYQCFAPGHFLLTEAFFHRYGSWLLPDHRPIDNVKAGWDRPQEDEFALMNLGAPSPYRRIAFPRSAQDKPEALDVTQLNPSQLRRWRQAMRSFLLRLQARDSRRPVLKSPTHTARVATLLEMFPEAQFIHITRNPYVVFLSTRRLWQALHHTQSLQEELDPRIDAYIFQCFREIRSALKRDRRHLTDHQIHELSYESLVDDPAAALEKIYKNLNLGHFAEMQKTLSQQLTTIKSYRTNNYSLSPELKLAISTEWHEFFEEYNYNPDDGMPDPRINSEHFRPESQSCLEEPRA